MVVGIGPLPPSAHHHEHDDANDTRRVLRPQQPKLMAFLRHNTFCDGNHTP